MLCCIIIFTAPGSRATVTRTARLLDSLGNQDSAAPSSTAVPRALCDWRQCAAIIFSTRQLRKSPSPPPRSPTETTRAWRGSSRGAVILSWHASLHRQEMVEQPFLSLYVGSSEWTSSASTCPRPESGQTPSSHRASTSTHVVLEAAKPRSHMRHPCLRGLSTCR